MVSTRSMTARAKARRSAIVVALPHDVVVNIIGLVAASSPQPMADLYIVRATCTAMYKVSKERAVGRRVTLEREEAMKWLDNERYLAVVNHLADTGNPEACFIVGSTLVCLERAAVAGHNVAACVLSLLLYTASEARDIGKHYINLVESELAGGGCETAKRTNRECKRCRRLTADAVQQATWSKMVGPQGRVLALPKDGHRCTSTGCGVTKGWDGYFIFCSDECWIRHDYAKFFIQVKSYLS